ncbi:hypothetical protein ABT095_28405 [Kitasatospora sp. NPDC002227]|uniref:hypothetical protein n=1 Tax=Kitasatospora sp. NPDC002227 TaxID=3154773 RepID=UPI003330F97F
MATSRALRYLESTKNLVGCGLGAGGLVLHLAGLGGPWWPALVAGLYAAGALLAPGRTPPDDPWRRELDAFAARAAEAGVPASVGLRAFLDTIAPGPAGEHLLHRQLPLALAGFVRARTWESLDPQGTDPAEEFKEQLERLSPVRRPVLPSP